MDPHQLSKLGLADAERAAIMRPDAAAPHICKGNALQAIEEYIDAEAAFFAALSRDPSNKDAQVQSFKYHTWCRSADWESNVLYM